VTYHYWYSYSLEKQNIKSVRSWGQGYKFTLLVILPRDDRPSKCRYVKAVTLYFLLWLIYGVLNYSQGNHYLCVPIKDIYVQGLMKVNTQNNYIYNMQSIMNILVYQVKIITIYIKVEHKITVKTKCITINMLVLLVTIVTKQLWERNTKYLSMQSVSSCICWCY